MPKAVAIAALVKQHDLDAGAAENLMRYLADHPAAVLGRRHDSEPWPGDGFRARRDALDQERIRP